MKFSISQLKLSKPINLFLIIQAIGIVWMAYLHASGQMFPASVLLTINCLLFIFRYGQLSFFSETGLNKIFILLTITSVISFTNYLYYERYTGGLFFNCTLFQLFCYSLLWVNIYIFFYIYVRRNNNYDIVYIFAILFFIAGIINNFRSYQYFRVVNDTLVQHHYYYFTLQCLPLLLMRVHSWKKYILILIVTLCSIYAFKRAGIIVCGGILLANIIIDTHYKFHRLVGLLFIVSGIFYGTYYYMKGNENIDRIIQRIENIQDDKGSGRGENFVDVYNEISHAPIENKILGYGFMSMLSKHKHMVDVEIASMYYYYGIIGLILYLLFHCFMIFRFFSMITSKDKEIINLSASFASCYVIFLIYSIAGEVFTYHYLFIMVFVYLGTIEGLYYNKKQFVIKDKRNNKMKI